MAEGARLESVYTGNRIVGSNPTPSANRLVADVSNPLMHGSIRSPLPSARQIATEFHFSNAQAFERPASHQQSDGQQRTKRSRTNTV